MPEKKARGSAQPELLECAFQLRRLGDKLNSLWWEMEGATRMLAEVPGKKTQKGTRSLSPTRLPAELEADCAQLRRIGDRLTFQQKLLNLISKLFNVVT